MARAHSISFAHRPLKAGSHAVGDQVIHPIPSLFQRNARCLDAVGVRAVFAFQIGVRPS